MNIGQASARSGLSSKTIRYYEEIGLVVPGRQPQNQYRAYNEADLAQLSFLNAARQLGISMEDCRSLLELYRNPEGARSEVMDLALAQVQKLDEQLERLNAMRARLLALVRARPDNQELDNTVFEGSSKKSLPKMSFTLMETDS